MRKAVCWMLVTTVDGILGLNQVYDLESFKIRLKMKCKQIKHTKKARVNMKDYILIEIR
jgi:hypothetical protein